MSTIGPRSTLETAYQKFNKQLDVMVGYEETLSQQHQELQTLYNSSFLVRRLVPEADLKRNPGYVKIFNKLFGSSVVSLTGDFWTFERSAQELSSSLFPKSLKDSQFTRLSSVREEEDVPELPADAQLRNLSSMMEVDGDYTQDKHVDIEIAKKNIESWKRSYISFLKALPVMASSNPQYHEKEKDLLTQATSSISSRRSDIDPGYDAFARLRIDDYKMWIGTYRSLANLEDRAKSEAYTYVSRPITNATDWIRARVPTLSHRQVTVAASMAITAIAAITWQATRESADGSSD